MTSFYHEFFKAHPAPMFIADAATHAFLDVNGAALALYGHSEAEFLSLTTQTIRPAEDVLAAETYASTITDGPTEAGVWRHRRKSGEIFLAEIRFHTIDFQDRKARLVTVKDVSELMQAREEAQRLRGTLENMSDAFFTLDNDWCIAFVNRLASDLLGHSPEQLVHMNVWDTFPEAIGTRFDVELRQALETGKVARFTEYYAPFGKWLSVDAHPSADGLAVYFRDVSEQRTQDVQIRLLESAVSRLNDLVVITEPTAYSTPLVRSSRIVYVNDAFLARTRRTREEVIGRSTSLLYGPKTQPDRLEDLRMALRENRPARAELINYSKDGEEFWTDTDVVPILDALGKQTHWVAVSRDITERKQNQEALAVSEERFRIVSQATSDVVWDWDLTVDTVWWNNGMHTVFGHDVAEMSTSSLAWSANIDPDDVDRVLTSIKACIKGSETVWSHEYRFRRADGSHATVADRAFVIRDVDGRALRMVGSMQDVTQQRSLEAQLRQAQRLDAVGQLTGGVAHDFNNLLTVILGNASVLADQLPKDQQLRLLAEMTRTAAERGAELTSRLLAFSRRQALDPKAIDVNKLVSGMDGLMRRTLGGHIEIETVRGGGLWRALVDGSQLENAVLNLCINARDAMEQGGRLTIEMANVHLDESYAVQHGEVTAGQYAMIAVSDTGVGMDGATMARVFEPFFTTKEVGKGSGLGLSMVYGFIKQSKGHVKIYSEPGLGTTVKLYLPRADASADQPDQLPLDNSAPTGKEKILVVEDDDLVREHVRSQLFSLGYQVVCVRNGRDAVEALKQIADFDLLFTDVVMPGGLNGRQLADETRRLRPGLPVLFTSGYTENAIVHHGRLDRGVQLLNKPYRLQDLARKVRAVLDAAARERS